ncbi:MAG: YaaA family protein [Clostridium sp.]|nr:YaaA family protein [Clostridium sp.]
MQILLANAKIMHAATGMSPESTPLFQAEANRMALELASMDTGQLARLLNCSPALAAENGLRYRAFFDAPKRPALLSYNGQAYKHLKADTLTASDLEFAQRHMWITCFLYGLLRPLDGIVPYRMEHSARLEATDGLPLNRFWRERLTDVLIRSVQADDGVLVHLSTAEYEQLFDWPKVKAEVQVVQPLFYVATGGRLRMQAVWAKACRGALTRFIIKHRLTSVTDLQAFSHEGFAYRPDLGEVAFPHFVRP